MLFLLRYYLKSENFGKFTDFRFKDYVQRQKVCVLACVCLSVPLRLFARVLMALCICPCACLLVSLLVRKIIKTYDIRFWPMTSGSAQREFDLEDPPQWAKNKRRGEGPTNGAPATAVAVTR